METMTKHTMTDKNGNLIDKDESYTIKCVFCHKKLEKTLVKPAETKWARYDIVNNFLDISCDACWSTQDKYKVYKDMDEYLDDINEGIPEEYRKKGGKKKVTAKGIHWHDKEKVLVTA